MNERMPPNRLPPDAAAAALPVPSSRNDLLAELARVIEGPQTVPHAGIEASKSMAACFEATAADVERLAQEAVDRALALQQEAQTFAALVREAGTRLCTMIEDESRRGAQISQVMRTARTTLDPSLGG